MRNLSKVILTAILFFALSLNVRAQISSLVVGVDGFTCSLCAKGVAEQFKALDFVKSVKTDIKKTEFTLYIKPGQIADISIISEAVSDGGFTLRDIKIDVKGSLKGDANSGYFLTAPNISEFSLKDVKGKFSDGDKVSLKGKIFSPVTTINVTSIKKL
ncbi:MAG TPA: heavy-metal-associated domain-containing protein [Ignavibacteria bacterium]|nr:heavy-metal-associated domain-containing protein [Ignavibacteria bacterium]